MFKDYLERKEFRLAHLEAQSARAIDVITNSITELERVNLQIDNTMEEINEYQNKLACTMVQLSNQKERNEKLLDNFNKLLA